MNTTEVEILGPASDKADAKPLAESESGGAMVTATDGELSEADWARLKLTAASVGIERTLQGWANGDITPAEARTLAAKANKAIREARHTLATEAKGVTVVTETDRALRLKRTQLVTPAIRKDGGLKSQRGSGSIYKTSWTDRRTGLKCESKTWWVSFYLPGKKGPNGKRKRERIRIDTHETDKAKARAKLTVEMAKAHLPNAKDPRDVKKLEFDAIEEAILRHYREEGLRSADRIQIALRHLGEFFTGHRVVDIDAGAIERFKDARVSQGASVATVNRELSALKLGFGLLEKKYEVRLRPYFKLFKEDNVREGFVVEDQLQRLLPHLPAHIAPLVECAYLTGWRLSRELLTRTRDDVIDLDNENAHLFLDAKHSKNGSPRRFYFSAIPRVREIVEAQIADCDRLEAETGQPVVALFHHRVGKPIRDIRRRWEAATKAAGLDGLLMHDLRRSAVKNLNDAGIPRELAKLFTGHKSDAVYARYSIESDESLKLAAAKLGAHFTARAAKVVPLRKVAK